MSRLFAAALAALFTVALGSCGQVAPTADSAELLAARGGTDRPLKGSCTVAVNARVHEEEGEEEEGGCGGGGGEEGETPPIPRHYTITGTCQLTHLGLVRVSGRMNLTGPFNAHEGEEGEGDMTTAAHGRLMVRGRLGFMAANGDLLGGSYIPVSASFERAAGRVQFTSAQTIGASCSDLGGGGGEGGHDEPALSGRFVGATGQTTLLGDLLISSLTKSGSGTIAVTGLVSY